MQENKFEVLSKFRLCKAPQWTRQTNNALDQMDEETNLTDPNSS